MRIGHRVTAFKSPADLVENHKRSGATDQGVRMRHEGAVAHPDIPRTTDDGDGDRGRRARPPVDETVIDQLASITDVRGESVLGELLNAFLGAVPGRLEALDLAVARADIVAVAEQAHALTGSAASFGAVGMAELCRGIRVVTAEGDLDGAAGLVRELQAEFVRVRAWLVDFGGRP